MNPRCILNVTLAGLGMLATVASAELEVIYDSGATRPLAPFLEVFGESPHPTSVPRPTGDLGAADVSRLLPIRSPGLTPGQVTRRALNSSHAGLVSRPFFLIGSDSGSIQWLTTHRDRLKALGAVGMLVQAKTVEDLETIARIAKGLPILPASASDIARALGIEHYPILISRRGIEQ